MNTYKIVSHETIINLPTFIKQCYPSASVSGGAVLINPLFRMQNVLPTVMKQRYTTASRKWYIIINPPFLM